MSFGAYIGECPVCKRALWSKQATLEHGKAVHKDCATPVPTEPKNTALKWTRNAKPEKLRGAFERAGKLTHDETKEYEERLAKDFGGHRYRCSGASAIDGQAAKANQAMGEGKGETLGADVYVDEGPVKLHMEHKRTRAKSYTLTRDNLRKVVMGANHFGREPAFVVAFQEERQMPEEWVLLPKELVLRLLHGYREE